MDPSDSIGNEEVHEIDMETDKINRQIQIQRVRDRRGKGQVAERDRKRDIA